MLFEVRDNAQCAALGELVAGIYAEFRSYRWLVEVISARC